MPPTAHASIPAFARRLSPGETALARAVFGQAIALERVLILRRRRGRFAFVVGSTIRFPPGAPDDFAAQPPDVQAWLVHELVHVWQFQTAPWRTLASWLGVMLSGGYGRGLPGYAYRLPLRPWSQYNLEQQARILEHAFLLQSGRQPASAPAGATAAAYRNAPFCRQPLDSMDKPLDPTEAPRGRDA